MKTKASTRQALIFSTVIVAVNLYFFAGYSPAPRHLDGMMEQDLDIVFRQLKEIAYLIVWFLYNNIIIIWAVRSYQERQDEEAIEPKSKQSNESLEKNLKLMYRAMGGLPSSYEKELSKIKTRG